MKGNVTPVFPAAGVAVAALVRWGTGVWPGVLLGALAAHLTTEVDVPTAVAMSIGGPASAVGAAVLLRRTGFDAFVRVRDALAFVGAGVLLPATVSAVCGVTVLLLDGAVDGDGYAVALGSWWVGDAIGAMVAGALLLAWTRPPSRQHRSIVETTALVVTATLTTGALFQWTTEGEALLLPLLVLVAVRLQVRWTMLAVTGVTLLAAAATARGHGPFVESTENESLVQLSLFLASATLTTLVLSTALAERDRAGDQAHHDELTGLPNRLHLLEQLDAAVARRQPFSLLFADLDGLKQVNDTLGHECGDELLVGVADRIRDNLRSGDVAARLAGDEFTVIAFGADDADTASAAGQRLLDLLVAEPFDVRGTEVRVTASVGAVVARGEADPVTLLRVADEAMYDAKRAGGARVTVTA